MISLRDLKTHLKVDLEQAVEDQLILDMEAAAVAYMENETGQYFGAVADFEDVLSPRGWSPLWLSAIPIDADYFVLERRSTPSGTWEVVDPGEYEIDGQRLYPTVFWTAAHRTLRASYTAGYAENAEPGDVRVAVLQLVTRMYAVRLPSVVEVDDSVRQCIRANKITVV